MTPAKFLAYSLCDKLETKTVRNIIDSFRSNGWRVDEVEYKPTPIDHAMPAFDKGQDFSINFPDALFSRIEFLTVDSQIVQARARLDFKQALLFSKASKHVWHLNSSLDYYYGASRWTRPQPSIQAVNYQNAYTLAYLTRTISDGHDTVVYCVGSKAFW